jgi:hypothetical protein
MWNLFSGDISDGFNQLRELCSAMLPAYLYCQCLLSPPEKGYMAFLVPFLWATMIVIRTIIAQ